LSLVLIEISRALDAARNVLIRENFGFFVVYLNELPLRIRHVGVQTQFVLNIRQIAQNMEKMAGISHQCLMRGVSEHAWASELEGIPTAWLLFGAQATPFGMEVFNHALNPFR
jgi:hypothetical protein